MKPFTFKTESGNCYLYSPIYKQFICVPKSTYSNLISGRCDDSVSITLKQNGYLNDSISNFERQLSKDEIYNAFLTVPQIVFEVTTYCNLSCKYCCYGHNYETFANRASGNLKFEYAKTILDFFAEWHQKNFKKYYGSPLVLSFYGGEPLIGIELIKQIVDYSKTINMRGRKFKYSLTTNATFLEKNIEFLVENEFSLLVSLDGNKHNNSYRVFNNGIQSYDTVISNLLSIKKRFPEYFKTIRFNSVFTNLSDTNSLFNFFYTEFGVLPTISPLHYSDSCCENEELKRMHKKVDIPDNYWYHNVPSSVLEIPDNKRIIHMLLYMTNSLYYDELSFLNDSMVSTRFPTHSCIPFSKRMFVSFDGKIFPCEKVNRDNPLAKIKDSKLEIDFEQIANYYNGIISTYKHQCTNCALELMCNHCAFSSTKAKICPEYMERSELSNIFSKLFSYIENNPKLVDILLNYTVLK